MSKQDQNELIIASIEGNRINSCPSSCYIMISPSKPMTKHNWLFQHCPHTQEIPLTNQTHANMPPSVTQSVAGCEQEAAI